MHCLTRADIQTFSRFLDLHCEPTLSLSVHTVQFYMKIILVLRVYCVVVISNIESHIIANIINIYPFS